MKRLSRADILIMFGYSAGTKLYNLLYSSCANFCCIVKNCLGISSGGNAGLVLNQQGDWVNPQQFIEVANYAALPVTGEASKIYVTLDTNKLYRWTGSTYVEVAGEDTTDDITLDFTSGVLTYTMYSPYAMSITSVTNVNASPTTTITKNTSPYILGTSIALGDTLVITVSVSSVIRLNIFKI